MTIMKSMPGDSVVPSLALAVLVCLLSGAQILQGSPLPEVSEALDSLAADIAERGYVPRGGDLLLMAAANGWYGFVSDVIIHPGVADWRDVSYCVVQHIPHQR